VIFGKTEAEQRARIGHREIWFAWRPVRLLDGRVAWLERVRRCWDEYAIEFTPDYGWTYSVLEKLR
jgi:hypothetical protein